MITILLMELAYMRTFLIARHRLAMESVALRQELAVYKRKQPRPRLSRFDRLFWVVVRRIWGDWSEALILVKPIRWSLGIAPATVCSGDGNPAGSA